MGYFENCCQICGVSFNLARCRTKYEAAEAGWGYSNGLYYSGDTSSCLETDEEGGCEDITVNRVENVHIAGLGCIFNGGYSGHRISVEEMKNMRLSRYIIKKPKNAPEEKDATDYEKCSDFFITDQTTTTQDHYEPGNLPRDRYGVGFFFPQNYLVIDEGEFFGVPVHDACWKIFERVSKLRLGRVDLQGFMALWYRSACGSCGFQTIKQEPIVDECKQQFWSHVPGTEYLAANPHDIVGFSRMALESYHYTPRYRRNDLGVYMKKPCRKPPKLVYVNPTDPFSKLPLEIKSMILFNLQAKDIGSLRYVSREFRQLSQEVFRHLILKELPWFWEIDELQQRKLEQTRKMYVIQFGDDLSRLEEGNWDDEHKQYVKDCVALKPQSLLNWKAIYDRVKILQKGILGVRNRARVWELAERITERIGKLRESSSSEKRYDLRDEEDLLSAKPTIEELENDLVNEGFDCLDCQTHQIERIENDCQNYQIERMADDEEMED